MKEGQALFKAESKQLYLERENAHLTAHDELLTNHKQRRGRGNKKQDIKARFFHRRWDGTISKK